MNFIFCSSIVCSAHPTYASRRLLLSKKNQFLVRWKRKAIYMELLIYSTLSCGGEVQTKKRLFGKEINTSWAGPGSANLMSSGEVLQAQNAERFAIFYIGLWTGFDRSAFFSHSLHLTNSSSKTRFRFFKINP